MTSRRTKRRVHVLLTVGKGGRLARAIDWLIVGLIVLNVVAVVLATVDSVFERYRSVFYAFEIVSIGVFTLEYGLRIWSATAVPEYSSPITGRLRFGTRPHLLIDLFAIVPFYVGTVVFAFDLRVLRALRLFRFLRLLKLVRYSEAMQRFGRVAHRKRDDLLLAITGSSVLLVVASSLMYFVERDAQPETFSSIPATLWWGVVTLTTVAYGNTYPVTPAGKVLGGLVAVLGVGLFALPASILASGFIEDDADPRRCPHCGESLGTDLPGHER
ncbi:MULTISPECIES: potassium channel family protein [Saliphagus]|uniref:Potassium channel family protein n=1 Tax=Saliphagus infecundisoli TaxID=1849069 RepID=A0ABD5QKV1_9EURY|nr:MULTISPECIES: potassium channel family protein [Saliphagus]